MKKILKYILFLVALWLIAHLALLFYVGLNSKVTPADAILIFGNKVEENGVPSKRLQGRLEEGLFLFSEKMAPLIIVSGGMGKEGYDEAEVMKKYLIQKGVPPEAIVVDNKGYDSYQTAQNTKQIAQKKEIKKLTIVSQYYHLLRARLALKKFGFDSIQTSAAKSWPEWRDFYSIPREVIGYYYYVFRKYPE